jgi:hypothetical protein
MTFWSFLPNFVKKVPKYESMFHIFWNFDPLSVPVPLCRRAVLLLDHVIRKIWNSSTFSLKKMEPFHFFWNCSAKSGTVPLCVGLLGYCPNVSYLRQWQKRLCENFMPLTHSGTPQYWYDRRNVHPVRLFNWFPEHIINCSIRLGREFNDHDFVTTRPKLRLYGQNGQSKFDHYNLYNSRFLFWNCWNSLKLLKYLSILTIWW